MSMYGMVFGQHEGANEILSTLGLAQDDFGRFRDCWVSGGQIHVYTRCGGGNRRDYKDVFKRMYRHPNFIEEADDDFDYTYCTFLFSFPEEYKEVLSLIDNPDIPSGQERWDDFLSALRKHAGP